MTEILTKLDQWHAMEIFFVASIVLILVDYFFKGDYPAYFGYFCCAAGLFLAVPFELPLRALVGIGTWVLLLVLHRVWFTHFLTNAHDVGEAA